MNLAWGDVICDSADRAYAREQMRKRRMKKHDLRTFNCATCGAENVATNARKKYCNEYCRNKSDHRNAAERMRNFRARLKRKSEKL